MGAGIDYGYGRTNIDKENGIRYGVISQHSISQAWADSAEPDYGAPTCPKCGREVSPFDNVDADTENFELYCKHGCSDFACIPCELVLDSFDVYGEDPTGWNYQNDGYVMVDCLDSEVMVIKSPYYTFTAFCSPCVPGAGDLDSTDEDGVKTYCVGHDWFEGGAAPYPVYSVETGNLVQP